MTGLETVNEGEAVKPIADPRRREQQPDDAALDELRKAFGGAPHAAVTGAASDAAAEATVEPPVVEPAVVEPTTVSPTPTGPSEPPAQPRIVRIDDYAASHAEPPRSAGAPGPAVDPLIAHPPKPAPPERQMIAIDADDLPDAVYVEGSLETGGSGSIVFIEDDIAADALTPESDRDLRRGIEPRMKERRLAVKRAQGRKRLRWLV